MSQCVLNTICRPKYKYLWVKRIWRIQSYSGWHFFQQIQNEYIWISFFRQIDWYSQIWMRMGVLSHQRKKIDTFIDMKSIKVWQVMHLCAIKYNLWRLVYKIENIQNVWLSLLLFLKISIRIYSGWQKGQIWTQIYSVWIKMANKNRNIFWLTKKGKN